MKTPEGLPPIIARHIDAILPFLDRFETATFSAGTWKVAEGQMPFFNFVDTVVEFRQALYDNGWVTRTFNWNKWQQSAKEFLDSPEKIKEADVVTIQKLFTTHVRADRFWEGSLAWMFENGQIVALLRRLKIIRDEML